MGRHHEGKPTIMTRRPLLAVLVSFILLATLSLVSAPVAAEEFVVRLDDAEDATSAEQLREHAEATQPRIVERVEREGGEVVRRFWVTNAVLVEGNGNTTDLRRSLGEDGYRVHDNYVFDTPNNVSNDTDITLMPDANPKPAVEQMNVTPVWQDLGVLGEGVKVVVLDTGVDVEHQDIKLRTDDPDDPTYPGGWAEFNGEGRRIDSEPNDEGVHGTHVSGTVAGGNESGTAIGVAPEAELMHAKVFNGSGTFAQLVAGLEWSVEQNPDVLSLSFGVPCTESPVYVRSMIEPIRNVKATGTFVVASSGNDGENCTSSPGNIYDSFTVGAVNSEGDVARFSSGGKVNTTQAWGNSTRPEWPDKYLVPDVTAPGVGILSSVPGGEGDRYGRLDGTSMATPHVAGVSALAEAATDRDMLPIEHRAVLVETAKKPGGGDPNTRHGVGIVDAYDAVELAKDEEKVGNITPVNQTHLDETEDKATPLSGFGAIAGLVALLMIALRKRL